MNNISLSDSVLVEIYQDLKKLSQYIKSNYIDIEQLSTIIYSSIVSPKIKFDNIEFEYIDKLYTSDIIYSFMNGSTKPFDILIQIDKIIIKSYIPMELINLLNNKLYYIIKVLLGIYFSKINYTLIDRLSLDLNIKNIFKDSKIKIHFNIADYPIRDHFQELEYITLHFNSVNNFLDQIIDLDINYDNIIFELENDWLRLNIEHLKLNSISEIEYFSNPIIINYMASNIIRNVLMDNKLKLYRINEILNGVFDNISEIDIYKNFIILHKNNNKIIEYLNGSILNYANKYIKNSIYVKTLFAKDLTNIISNYIYTNMKMYTSFTEFISNWNENFILDLNLNLNHNIEYCRMINKRYILSTAELDDIEIEKYEEFMLININEDVFNILSDFDYNQIVGVIHRIIIKIF